VAKPMFFYAGVYDSSADAEMDYEAIAGMAGAGAWFGHLAHGTSREEARDIGAMLEPGTTALVVIGVDSDAEAIERAAIRAKRHTLKRQFGDWDEAEQDALDSIARAEQHAVA
jgi:hypothetical protein